jgi:hypothetical protein
MGAGVSPDVRAGRRDPIMTTYSIPAAVLSAAIAAGKAVAPVLRAAIMQAI